MRSLARISLLCSLAVLLSPACTARAAVAAGDVFFEKQVRPLLVARCLKCHGDAKPRGGLKLTSRAAVLAGGDTGPAAAPGKPRQSLLIQAVRYAGELKMPPKGKLSDREVAVLTRWVELNLPWPETAVKPAPAGATFHITAEQRRFWSFQPVKVAAAPAVRDRAWARSDLDRFILAALEAKGLRPARPADRRALIRRATFDLTGLPPTPEEVEAFRKDDKPGAFARVVDRLLASPHYGERWGRHWLDLVRYTDSFDARGIGGEMDCAHAWRYRDWVVGALNRDLPYDRFLTEQLAGDILAARDGFDRDRLVATGLLALGNWGGGDADKEKLLTDIADDQVDVVSRTFMGLTVACARCHDHKFDPIATKDYYGLAGIFFSTHILPNVGPKTNGPPMLTIPLLPPAELARRNGRQAEIARRTKELRTRTEAAYRDLARSQRDRTATYLMAAWDYQSAAGASVEAFAREKGLRPYALRQWIDYLGLGDYRLMTTPVRDAAGKRGVHGWRGAADCPSMLVNTTDQNVSILTFKLPPRAVAVHPGPSNGVVVAWRSPAAGTVRVTGRVRDADPVGGDGIAWVLEHRKAGSRRELATGAIPNGGAQRFDQGKGAARLAAVTVAAGDRIELLVLPKANYGFDTTVVEMEITPAGGGKAWGLTRDLAADPLAGNPHADGQGHAGVWHFLDMANVRRSPRPAGTALAAWDRAVARRDRKALAEAARSFQKTFPRDDARSPFWIKRPEDERHLPAVVRADLAKRRAELEAFRKAPLPPLDYANGAQEGGVPGSPHAGVHDVRVHHRGRYDRLGDRVPRHFPVIIAGPKQAPITAGSGRLQLAQWLTRPDHPLTARVMANRLWQYHFGEGLVRTPSNFGKLGTPPTHPELLDWLARQFIRSGWSMKQMHRLIMLSSTYRQASEPRAATLKADPDNLLVGRMNRRRLEAEAIRDNILAVSGRLDRRRGGRAVRDFAAPRRTLYLMTIRSDRSGFGPLFDAADPTAPVDRRAVSTVAPQALFLLNNPFILAQTQALARRIQSERKTDAGRVERAYALLYGRPPSAEEKELGLNFLKRAAAAGRAWEEYGEVLLCANEFIYVD